jgi:(p)ppGpp synthase/HD superfamily hydrolase
VFDSSSARQDSWSFSEDREVPKELIAETFGADVGALVQEVTDDKSLPKVERKDEQIKTAPKKSSGAKILNLTGKISNLRAIAASGCTRPSRHQSKLGRSIGSSSRSCGAILQNR